MSHNPSKTKTTSSEMYAIRTVLLFRYFSFMVGVGLLEMLPQLQGETVPAKTYWALGIIGVYTALRVFFPPRPRPGELKGYLSLAVEFMVAVGTMLATGGLSSGLLLYSLIVTVVAALYLELSIALTVAVASTVTVLLAHMLAPEYFGSILSENNLLIFFLFALATLITALVPFSANLNLRRRLQNQATEEERNRLRREIHDSLAQELAAVSLNLKQLLSELYTASVSTAARQLASAIEDLQLTQLNVRAYMELLSLPLNQPTNNVLKVLVDGFGRRTGIKVSTAIPDSDFITSPDARMQIIYIVQEALANVQKHAQAQQVVVKVAKVDDRWTIAITDDGKGFESSSGTPAGHYGLIGMRERASKINANLKIISSNIDGTTVTLTLPQTSVNLPEKSALKRVGAGPEIKINR